MALATIEDAMCKQVETIQAESTVERALAKMAQKEISSLVVVSQIGPVGIFSERDLVSRLVAMGKTGNSTLVTEVMSSEIVKFDPNWSLKQAAKTMNSRRNRLLVFRGDNLVGIITATDIVRAIHEMDVPFDIDKVTMKTVYTLKEKTSLKQAVDVMTHLRIGSIIIMRDNDPDGILTEQDLVRRVLVPNLDLKQPLLEYASRPLITSEEGVSGLEAAHLMTTNNVKRLPLTRSVAIVGIVTARDLVEAYANS